MRSACLKLGAVLLTLAPLATLGLAATRFLAPIEKQPAGPWYPVATLFDLPDDGQPVRVLITAHEHDAWTKFPDQTVGAVFLRRRPDDGAILAFAPEHHPLLHIPVEYHASDRLFRSNCWSLSFDLDGNEIEQDDLPAVGHKMPRLPVFVSEGRVWVRYEP